MSPPPAALASWGVPPAPPPVPPVLLGVLVCLGGPNSYAGYHHAALIAADGDFVLEHVSAQALRVPLVPDDLSPRAFSTYERLIASPPLCCRLPPHSPTPPARPPRAPAEARPPWHFDFFPLCLPPHAYRPPPLSEVLAAASRYEAPMFLTKGARPLVPSPPSPPAWRSALQPAPAPPCSPAPCTPAQRVLAELGVDTSQPGTQCYFPYLESAVKGYLAAHPGTAPPAHLLDRHLLALDDPCPTLAASHSCHPFLFGPRPYFLGPRALAAKQGLPPTDPLYLALLRVRPRIALCALGRGVHFLAASCVLHLVLTEAGSPLRGRERWRCASAFTGADTFGAALRALVPGYTLLTASEVSPPPSPPSSCLCPLRPADPHPRSHTPPLTPSPSLGAQPDRGLRALVHACYPHLPLEPGANFPSDVRDDGAFPLEPYDFAFWGFPCIKHSSLNRTATEADLVDALDLLGLALRRLSENPPLAFVLENTHSLLSGPRWVLARITSMLRQLPYDWRFAPCPRASALSYRVPPAACLAPRTPPPRCAQVHLHMPPLPLQRRVVSTSTLVGRVPPCLPPPLGPSASSLSPLGSPPLPPYTTRPSPALCTLPPLTPPLRALPQSPPPPPGPPRPAPSCP